MRIGKANISCGAFGQPSVPLSLSRRAHLLTTSSEQAVYPSLSRKRQSSLTTLFLLSPQSHGLCGDPSGGGVLPAADVRSARRRR